MDIHVRTLAMASRTMPILSALVSTGADTEDNEAMVIALWTSTVIQYARCFDKTFGKELPANEIFADSAVLADQHVELLVTRSKHMAHDVNAMRRADVGVEVSPDGRLGELVRPFAFRIPDIPETAILMLLLERAYSYAVDERGKMTVKLVKELHAMTPVELLALPALKYELLHKAPIDRSRR